MYILQCYCKQVHMVSAIVLQMVLLLYVSFHQWTRLSFRLFCLRLFKT